MIQIQQWRRRTKELIKGVTTILVLLIRLICQQNQLRREIEESEMMETGELIYHISTNHILQVKILSTKSLLTILTL